MGGNQSFQPLAIQSNDPRMAPQQSPFGPPRAAQSNDPAMIQHNTNHASPAWQAWERATGGWNPNHSSAAWQSWQARTHGWNPNLKSLQGMG